jgi:hypothetical protein
MFRCPSTTLPISRFPLASLSATLIAPLFTCAALGVAAASFAVSAPALAQDQPVVSAPSTTSVPYGGSTGSAAVAGSTASGATLRTDDGQLSGQAGASDAKAANAEGATGEASSNGFDARQAALNHRTEENNYNYGVDEHNCYSKFLVNYCLDKARDRMRAVQAGIRKEQLALDEEQRTARAQQRDQQAALQRAQDEANAPQRAAQDASNQQQYEDKQHQHQLDQAQRAAEAPQRAANEQSYQQKEQQHALDQAQRGVSPSQAAANQQAYDQKQANFQTQLEQAREQGAQKAQERVEKQQSFQRKQETAAQHEQDVATRQKQAADKAQQKQQQQLQQHRVEQLRAHLARRDRVRQLEDAIGERRLAVVDVRDDREVADVRLVHGVHYSLDGARGGARPASVDHPADRQPDEDSFSRGYAPDGFRPTGRPVQVSGVSRRPGKTQSPGT